MREALVLPVPQLAGELVSLRPWQLSDAAALAAAWADPEINQRLEVPSKHDTYAARRWIDQRPRAWSAGVSADMVIAELESDSAIGEVGLYRIDSGRRAALIGWWIAAGWRGQGRACEAVSLTVEWLLGEGLLDAVLAEIDADNLASVAIARRAGLRQMDIEHPDGHLLFARTI